MNYIILEIENEWVLLIFSFKIYRIFNSAKTLIYKFTKYIRLL